MFKNGRKATPSCTGPCLVAGERGQMTVEFLVVLPIALIIGLIAVNALLFFSECAAFDRVARNAARTYAASPAYGQTTEQTLALIEASVKESFHKENLSTLVRASSSGFGHTRYEMTLLFSPTLFGLGMRSSVLGVALPQLEHTIALTVDSYKPGVLL